MNTYVNGLTLDETVEEVHAIVRRGVPTQHVVINASKINLMEKDERLREIVSSCPLINADGASIVWASRQLGVPVPERVAGIDLFLRLAEESSKCGYRIFLFGATEEVVLKVRRELESRFPGIIIAGTRNGYFKEEDDSSIVREIRACRPDLLFVGFSSPKKEYWISEHLNELGVPFAMGVGGSFDVLAGKTKRAPRWMQRCGLEWFYRFAQEPHRLWRRYIVGNFKFVRLVSRYKPARRQSGGASES